MTRPVDDSRNAQAVPESALVFNIQRFSVHDGPGIRTTVFLKGCNLGCFWCHNPESIDPRQEIQLFPEKCIGCGNCFEACPVHAHQMVDGRHLLDRELCTRCGACVGGCYAEALVQAAEPRTVADVHDVVLRDHPYYEESGGGLTVSGGEPLLAPGFLSALLAMCRDSGVHTAVDSAVHVPWRVVEDVLPLVDLFLVDFKHIDSDVHRAGVGVPNERILENIARLAVEHPHLWIRVPVIPDFNDSPEVLGRMAEFLAHLGPVERVDLLPFHRLAGAKYYSLGRDYHAEHLEAPGEKSMADYREIFARRKLPVGSA